MVSGGFKDFKLGRLVRLARPDISRHGHTNATGWVKIPSSLELVKRSASYPTLALWGPLLNVLPFDYVL